MWPAFFMELVFTESAKASDYIRVLVFSLEGLTLSCFAFLASKRSHNLRAQIAQSSEVASLQSAFATELNQHRSQLEAAIQAMNDGLMIFDMQGNVVLANEAEARINGFAIVDEMKKNLDFFSQLYEFRNEADEVLPIQEWPASKVLAGESVQNLELKAKRLDTNQEWYFNFSGEPARDDHGKQILAVVITRDVTVLKSVELALKDSEERFRTMANSIPQLAWMTDEAGWIFWYNQRWYDYTGTTLKEMEGWEWKSVHHPDHVDRVVRRFEDHLRTGVPWEDKFPLRSASGEWRWFLSRAEPVRDGRGKIIRWFGSNTDITEDRLSEERLKATQAELQEAVKEAVAANNASQNSWRTCRMKSALR